jgi:hypothetical protein
MITPEEIDRRVEEHDAPRSARRSAAAKRIAELAGRRAALAEQLGEIERALGDELAAAQEVMDVDELASFTELPAADLTRWLTAHTARKPGRAKRKRTDGAADGERGTHGRRHAPRTSTASPASAMPEPAAPRLDATDEPTRVPAGVA